MTIREALNWVKSSLREVSEDSYLESFLLVAHVTGLTKERLLLNMESLISADNFSSLRDMVNRRISGVPHFYITGAKWFFGLEFAVNENVLIPRDDTEILVEKVLSFVKRESRILDIGTGSGCILLSLLHNCAGCTGMGIDISKEAIEVAKINMQRLGLSKRVEFLESSIEDFSEENKFDIIVSNPPYVRSDMLNNLKGEPRLALDGGEEGTRLYPIIARKAFSMLNDHGVLALEIDECIKDNVCSLLEVEGFKNIVPGKDYAGLWRFVVCEKSA